MGTIYQRGPWLWLGFVGPDGKRHMRSAKLRVGQEAETRALLAKLEAAIAERSSTAPAPLTHTVASWAEIWAQRRIDKGKWTNAKLDKTALQRHVVEASITVHRKQIALGRLRLEEVRVLHIRAWLEAMEAKQLAANTVLSTYSLMNRMFRAAVREELLSGTPCLLERGELPQLGEQEPDGRPEDAVFTLRELEQLISDKRLPLDRRVGYAISLLGGLRQGELAALTWADYDSTLEPLGRLYVSKSYTRRNKRVKSTKSGVTRWVPVHPALAALLAEWQLSGWSHMLGRRPQREDLLLPNRAGRFLTDLNLWGNLQSDLKLLSWRPRTFHDTRATFITYAIAGGASWELLKHISHGVKRRSRKMNQVYVRPPWEVLCAQVQCIKLELRGDAEVVSMRATGTAPLHSGATFDPRTHSTARDHSEKPQCPGRDSNPSDCPPPRDATRQNKSFTNDESRHEASEAAKCSAGATFSGAKLPSAVPSFLEACAELARKAAERGDFAKAVELMQKAAKVAALHEEAA